MAKEIKLTAEELTKWMNKIEKDIKLIHKSQNDNFKKIANSIAKGLGNKKK